MKRSLISLGVMALTVIVLVSVFASGVSVTTSGGKIGLSIGQVQADELSDWTIKFNPTGTHFKDGYLKIRLDFYPSKISKAYSHYYVYVPVIREDKYTGKLDNMGNPIDPIDYQKWLDGLSHTWQLNPAFSQFIIIDANITSQRLIDFLSSKFNADTIAAIDNYIMLKDSIHYLSPYLRNKSSLTTSKTLSVNQTTVITTINERLKDFNIAGDGAGIPEPINRQSIDIGDGATDRATSQPSGYTLIANGNTANADGTITTFQIWPATDTTGLYMGTFSYSGAVHDCRDAENLGNAAAGSVATFNGLSCDVLTGDKIGEFCSGGTLEADNSGGAGDYYYSGSVSNQCFAGSSQTYSAQSGFALSLYGTGTESGGTPSLTNTPASKDMGTVYPDGRAIYAKGNAPGNPVETGNCTFIIVNNGSITENITASMTNLTGGAQWTITSSAPGADTFRLTAYYAGQDPASGVVLSTSAQAFYNGLAASANISWDFKLEMPTSTTDTTAKTGTLQLTAIAP